MWFPGMDRAVERAVTKCHPCQAQEENYRSTTHTTTTKKSLAGLSPNRRRRNDTQEVRKEDDKVPTMNYKTGEADGADRSAGAGPRMEDGQLLLKVVQELLISPLLPLKVVQEVAWEEPIYQKLKEAVQGGHKPEDRDMVTYKAVWTELRVIQGLVCRGERILIPEGKYGRHKVPLRLDRRPRSQFALG